MNKLPINTAQNVQFDYKLATLGARMLAFAIDYFLIICYSIFVFYFLNSINLFKQSDLWLTYGIYTLLLLPCFFYPLIMETFFRGQTVGKMLLKIKVVTIDGTRADIYQYFMRWICMLIDVFLCLGALGISSIIISKRAQRIGDLAANTAVISSKSDIALQQTLFEEITREHSVRFPQVINLSDQDANSIKEIFHKAYERKDYNIILALRDKLSHILGVSPEIPPEEFIDSVIKDYYYTFRNR